MLKFVHSLMNAKGHPIGVDFGADALRLAQVSAVDGGWELLAAASCDVPEEVRAEPARRGEFLADTTRTLLRHGGFNGKAARLALPASQMHIQHLRLPRMDAEQLAKALPYEAAGKLPIDPTRAILRHLVAGEVHVDNQPHNEVIVMAAAREQIEQMLGAAERAKLDVVGMNVEPLALLDCFARIYRRREDATAVTALLDIGHTASRLVICCGSEVLFARAIPVGGDTFNEAVARALRISTEEARLLRIKLSLQPAPKLEPEQAARPEPAPEPTRAPVSTPADDDVADSFALLSAAMSKGGATAVAEVPPAPAAVAAPSIAPPPVQPERREDLADTNTGSEPTNPGADPRRIVEAALDEPVKRLVAEIEMCRRYYEATFGQRPVQRMVFVGGEARHKSLCQSIARRCQIAAQLGDPMVRLRCGSNIKPECGIEAGKPQPHWALAIGLSMGPATEGTPGAA